MKRRTLLIGLTAGTAAISGSGAFSAARVERDAMISVTSDANSLVGLVPNDRVAGVKEINNQLAIDIDEYGINVNSAYQFGAFVDNDDSEETWPGVVGEKFDPVLYQEAFEYDDNFRSAFAVVNQTQDTKRVALKLTITDDDGEMPTESQPEIYIQVHTTPGEINDLNYPQTTETAPIDLDPGRALGVSFALDASDSVVGDSLSGSLSVRAESVQ